MSENDFDVKIMEGPRDHTSETAERLPAVPGGHQESAVIEGGVTRRENKGDAPSRYETVDAFDLRRFERLVTETVVLEPSKCETSEAPRITKGETIGAGDRIESEATETTHSESLGDRARVRDRTKTTDVITGQDSSRSGSIDDRDTAGLRRLFARRHSEVQALVAEDGGDWMAAVDGLTQLLNDKALLQAALPEQRMVLIRDTAFALLALQEYDAALRTLRIGGLTSDQPPDARYFYVESEALLNRGQKEDAKLSCERAIKLGGQISSPFWPNANDCLELMCRISDTMGNHDEAESLEAKLPVGFVSTIAKLHLQTARKVNRLKTQRAKTEEEVRKTITQANLKFRTHSYGVNLSWTFDDNDWSGRTVVYRVDGTPQAYFEVFHHALENGNQGILEVLLTDQESAKLARSGSMSRANREGVGCVHLAARWKDPLLLKTLLEAGHDMNLEDSIGSTPVDHATGEGRKDTLRELLNRGAISGSVKNPKKLVPPLHLACLRKDLPIISMLINEYGCDVCSPSEFQGDTPLIYATILRRTEDSKGSNTAMEKLDAKSNEAVEYLLANGAKASIDFQGMRKSTALHWAAMLGFPVTVATLLRTGASAVVKDELGRTPRGAIAIGHTFNKRFVEVKKLLKASEK